MQNSTIYNVLKVEGLNQGKKQIDISEAIELQNSNLWKTVKKNSVKFSAVEKICNELGLEIIIRNPDRKSEYKININSEE